jgi:GT2 family glycosyltransferase
LEKSSFLFESLRNQTFHEWQLLILDNNSTDRTVEIIRNELKNITTPSQLIISPENLGFTGGHNTLFKKSDSEYVLLLNPDIYLMPDCLEKLKNFLDSHERAGAVTARLMKWDFKKVEETSLASSGFTDTIDSLGLKVLRSRRVVEWVSGKEWSKVGKELFCDSDSPRCSSGEAGRSDSEVKNLLANQMSIESKGILRYAQDDTDKVCEVFGISGALPMYRRSALQTVADEEGNIFDPLFFLYKEDVDLAFRLREAGYSANVVLDAVAYHDRTAAMPERSGDFNVIKNKQTQSELIKYHSYKNHLMMLYKNEYWQNLILDFPWILWYEFRKFAWFLLFNRSVLKGLGEIWMHRKVLKNERRSIKKFRKINWRNFRKWWN